MTQCWERYRKQIAREFAAAPETFLRQPTISQTLHPGGGWAERLASQYARDLQQSPYGMRLLSLARDIRFGSPYRFAEGCSLPAAQHAWQIALLKRFGVTPEGLGEVAEIGGGYGDMARQFRENHFQGSYRIFDLPELNDIQRSYLIRAGANASLHPLNRSDLCGGDAALLLATFSVSEMPLELRGDLEPAFFGFRYLLFSWNEKFADVDNGVWFGALNERLQARFDTQVMKDPHMRAWYLFARWRE